MLFSTLTFLFLFLPLVLLGNFLLPNRFRNVFLLLASLVFFAWGGITYALLFLVSLILNYFVGLAIGTKASKKFWLVFGLILNIANLVLFKYAGFIVENLNVLFVAFELESIADPGIILPIGISFYTFQAVSYLLDVYRGTNPYQKKFVNLALYISFFPQLIAGPIVRYHDIALQLDKRKATLSDFRIGIERFVLGLGKKVLLANQFALIADGAFDMPHYALSTGLAWIGAIAYSLQIYFDFSGYSDMAIGLGRMFGFKFLENFNFPYIAQSIQDFWRRWHISLSNWFRDYLYIPLGGNRKGGLRTYLNLFIVFFVTGFWHGSSWNFIVWGLFHGMFLILERWFLGALLDKAWKPLRHFYTLLLVLVAWVLFRAENLSDALIYLERMFVPSDILPDAILTYQLINIELYIISLVALFASAGAFATWPQKLSVIMESNTVSDKKKLFFGIGQAGLVMLCLLICTLYLSASTYNPFIYFRF